MAIFTFDLIHKSFGSLFADFVLRFLQNVRDGTNGFAQDFDVEAFKNFRNSFRKLFGIR